MTTSLSFDSFAFVLRLSNRAFAQVLPAMNRNQFFHYALRLCLIGGGIASANLQPSLGSDQIPGAPQKAPILIRNAIVHTVSKETLPKACLLIKEGKIAEIAADIAQAEGYEVIDAEGMHLYPGLIDSYSNLGLVEIDSIRASIDTTETGTINPNVRAAVAVNPDSEAIPVARANGILTALVAPTGGLVAGRASVMNLDGWTWEDMTIQADSAMIVAWPNWSTRARRGRGGPGAGEGDTAASDRLAPLHAMIRETKAYAAAKQADPNLETDLRLEAMLPVVDGKMPIMVSANSIKQIQTAVAFSKLHALKLIVFGGADAVHCADLLREAKVPVVVASVYRLPTRRDAGYDSAYALPAQLKAAGIPFCIASEGRFGASGLRNLPYNAATAIGFGLNADEALRAITLSPAEILGIADRVGSLDIGKDANIVLCDGDILDVPTHVQRAWIAGKAVDLTSKHTDLYDKYKTKYEQRKP